MGRTKKAAKVAMPKLPKGYSRLIGRGVKPTVTCYICKAPCTFAWDTIYGVERFSYCSGECIEVHLQRRAESLPIRELAREFNGRIIGEVTEAEQKEMLKLERLIKAYRDKYGMYPPVDNLSCVPIGFIAAEEDELRRANLTKSLDHGTLGG